jgi:hypothetical protein
MFSKFIFAAESGVWREFGALGDLTRFWKKLAWVIFVPLRGKLAESAAEFT